MKKLFVIASVILFSTAVFCQEDEPTDSQKRIEKFSVDKRNEVSIDVISAIAIPALNPRYEYILGRYSGVGVDLFVSLEGSDDFDNFSEYEKFSLTPYYRQYFFSKQDYGAKGFYAEVFLKFFTFEDQTFDSASDSFSTDSFFDTSIGAGIGWKWISESGFLVDLGIGIGRNFRLPSDDNVGWEVQPRGGLHFGWRF
ncbi:hypothetical protein [Flagellimonas algicola]|uniref:DUF3575 domain-containing protein n=1 Tax=Flagellimonas algicola TaxID=2583815 RepID=A0ABY2WFW4_9FLAO|nr:hypothetical protein [Allomuricauda algicola]TMU50422.1 hypothetical protein FGG15_19560 [Allomuricauda algicola]